METNGIKAKHVTYIDRVSLSEKMKEDATVSKNDINQETTIRKIDFALFIRLMFISI